MGFIVGTAADLVDSNGSANLKYAIPRFLHMAVRPRSPRAYGSVCDGGSVIGETEGIITHGRIQYALDCSILPPAVILEYGGFVASEHFCKVLKNSNSKAMDEIQSQRSQGATNPRIWRGSSYFLCSVTRTPTAG